MSAYLTVSGVIVGIQGFCVIAVTVLVAIAVRIDNRTYYRRQQDDASREVDQAMAEFGHDIDAELRELFRKRGESG